MGSEIWRGRVELGLTFFALQGGLEGDDDATDSEDERAWAEFTEGVELEPEPCEEEPEEDFVPVEFREVPSPEGA